MFKRLIGMLLLLGLAMSAWLFWYASQPVTSARLPAEFSVTPGSSLRKVAHDFESLGLLQYPAAFVLLGRLLGQSAKIKAGSYMLDKPVSPYHLLNKITQGDTRMAKLTVIEGWTFAQMRAAVEAHGQVKHEAVGMTASALMLAIGASEHHPEGLFFPDTYYFDAGTSDLNLYRRAYHTLAGKLEQAWQGKAADLPYKTPYEALIMASIIEKESGVPDERPQIAAVFLNRLRLGMRLQTDPTVIYGLADRYDGNLRKSDLLTDTLYNTYTRAGLPPTPIALPGGGAILSALHPDPSRALYFVAKGSGRHHFSNTLEEHNRAVNRYQRGGR